jgi:hypothetical protein
VTYDAVVDVQNPGSSRPGMTANVTFVFDARDALGVPNAALRFRPSPELLGWRGGAAPLRPMPRASRPIRVPPRFGCRATTSAPIEIETGITDGSYTEVERRAARGRHRITDTAGGAKPATAPGGGMPMRRVL